MNEPGPVSDKKRRVLRPVFVSYATANRKQALSICDAIEQRGARCWISVRDVEPGTNYQEAIARTIRGARAMVLIFSKAANRSDEIKKELSLASRFKIPVIALRIDDVEPSDAFAYELSTRQWIDTAEGRDKAVDALVAQLDNPAPATLDNNLIFPSLQGAGIRLPRSAIGVAAALALIVAAGSGWWFFRPAAPQHSLQVRLAGFQRVSSDVPATMPDAMRDEMIAAFGDDGIVGVSTAAAAPSGSAPAYALGGTIRRDGNAIKVIARLTDERTGTTLWSNSVTGDAGHVARLPRKIAIDTSMVIRCGLFGASTYPEALPERVFADYFEACENLSGQPDKALDFARKVVAAAPNFSFGWSAVEGATFYSLLQRPPAARAADLRQEGLAAANEALRLDGTNSEAYAYKSNLIPQADLVGREKLFQQAIHARALPCGCEHHFYGDFLMEVGRFSDAIAEYKRSIDIIALVSESQYSLGQAYLAIHRPDLAKEHINAALELEDDPLYADLVKVDAAQYTGDYSSALKAINDPSNRAPPLVRPALAAAFVALQSNNPAAKKAAIEKLEAMPFSARGGIYVTLLGALGANRMALDAVLDAASRSDRFGARSWLFIPAMKNVLRDPAFPAVADRLGLMQYWRSTHTKPDACDVRDAPRFCSMI